MHRILYQHPKTIAAELNIEHALTEACKLGLINVKKAIEKLQSNDNDWFNDFSFLTDEILSIAYY